MEITLVFEQHSFTCSLTKKNSTYTLSCNHEVPSMRVDLEKWDKKTNTLYFSHKSVRYKAQIFNDNETLYGIVWSTNTRYPTSAVLKNETFSRLFSPLQTSIAQPTSTVLAAPLTGKVITIFNHVGEKVLKGSPLLIIESMKMENEIRAPLNGIIKTILIAPGDVVETNQSLILFEEPLDEGTEDEKKVKNW